MSASAFYLEQILEPWNDDLSPVLARYVLTLSFPESVQRRHLKLSRKANRGTLSKVEQAELDAYLNTNAFLLVLQAKARLALEKHGVAK